MFFGLLAIFTANWTTKQHNTTAQWPPALPAQPWHPCLPIPPGHGPGPPSLPQIRLRPTPLQDIFLFLVCVERLGFAP